MIGEVAISLEVIVPAEAVRVVLGDGDVEQHAGVGGLNGFLAEIL